jgi:hypothetical protein
MIDSHPKINRHSAVEHHGKRIDLSKVPDIKDEDAGFLCEIFNRFPRVAQGYAQFTELSPERRIPTAANILQTQARTGWVLRFEDLPEQFRSILPTHGEEYYGPHSLLVSDVPKGRESVLEHCAEAQELFALVYRKRFDWPMVQWGMELLKFHDFHEAIDGDFTPNCPITKPEKKRLEAISTRLMNEAHLSGNLHTLHVRNCNQLFEGEANDFKVIRQEMLDAITQQRENGRVSERQKPAVDFFDKLYRKSPERMDIKQLQIAAGDIDALHMAIRACRMRRKGHIKPEDAYKLEEFWTYIDKKLQTSEAREFFETFRMGYLMGDVSYEASLAAAARSVEMVRGRT